MQPHQHLVIIGNGIAGMTLAQQVRKRSACAITLISAESRVHFSRPALMYVYMGHMRYQDIVPYADWYYKEQQLNTIQDKVVAVDFKKKILQLKQGSTINYDVLVLATGSVPAFYNWPGIQAKGVQGLVSLQDLELMEQQTKNVQQAVIVGGGLIGIEMAEMLKSRQIAVTMLIREKLFWYNNLPEQEAGLVTDHIRKHGVALLLQDELEEIVADAEHNVTAVKTRSGNVIPCQFVGIATGVKPNIEFLHDAVLQCDKGILVNKYFETSEEDVYAIGDCAQFKEVSGNEPAIEQLWYTARLHGEALAENLTGEPKPYNRGPWFNSAKFFDIEFQTYGYVPFTWDESEYASLYWEHPDKTKSIRLFYERISEQLTGINLLGVRYRHELCHYWLQHNYTIHEVMPELEAANFDSEFFKRFEPALLQQYHTLFPEKAHKTTKQSWWKIRENYRLFHTPIKSEDHA